MTTTASMLTRLNELREANGLKPLKAWKESKQKLEDAIRKLSDATIDEMIEEDKKVPCKAPSANPNPESITLAQIARELGINPKVARTKMRRVDVPTDFLVAKHTYRMQYKAWVIDVLRSDLRKRR